MTYQGGSYEFDEIVTALGNYHLGGNGTFFVRLRLLNGLPSSNG